MSVVIVKFPAAVIGEGEGVAGVRKIREAEALRAQAEAEAEAEADAEALKAEREAVNAGSDDA
jgi:regulator of protease activity HflC (stomatin/prohibitin superfamily)